jgi:hypothetical protein
VLIQNLKKQAGAAAVREFIMLFDMMTPSNSLKEK